MSNEGFVAGLPRGELLGADRWPRHHRILVAALGGHLLGLGVLARGPVELATVLALPAAGLIAALALRGRTWRSVAVALGLLGASAAFVVLSGGAVEAYLHLLVVLGLLTLYDDWRLHALALGSVAAGHSAAWLGGADLHGDARVWEWALVQAGLVLVVAAVHAMFSGYITAERRRSEAVYRQMYEGERAVVNRLRELEQMKNQLIGVVSHEFQTPLTGILGYARTMQAHLDDMDPVTVREFLRYIDRQGSRLSMLVENLTVAAESRGLDLSAVSNLSRVAARVGMLVGQHPGAAERPVVLAVPAELEVAMSADAAHRVLFNLVDNAIKFGTPGTDVRVEARRQDGEVVLEVANAGPPIPEDVRARMFDPFVQGDSSDSRAAEGMGLGLHVVRRLVESHQGTVEVHQGDGLIVFRVRLADRSTDAPEPRLRVS